VLKRQTLREKGWATIPKATRGAGSSNAESSKKSTPGTPLTDEGDAQHEEDCGLFWQGRSLGSYSDGLAE
jgi:hypothetical protein